MVNFCLTTRDIWNTLIDVKQFQSKQQINPGPIDFLVADAINYDGYIRSDEVSVIFVNSTAFTEEMMRNLSNNLIRQSEETGNKKVFGVY